MNRGFRNWLLFLVVLAILVVLPMQLLADNGNKDQDPTTPVKVGYVVVTPTSEETAGLVVFETFGEHKGEGNNNVIQAGVLPSTMTTHAAVFANANGRLSRNLGVAFANPSATAANITLTLRDDAGATVASKTFVLDSHSHTARFITELFENQSSVPRDFTGTLDITSDIPIAVMGLRWRGSNFSTVPATILGPVAPVPEIAPGIGGPDAVILAQFAVGGGWASEIILANFGSEPITVRVDLYAPDGSPLTATFRGETGSSFQNIIIPAGGVVTLASQDPDDDDEEDEDDEDEEDEDDDDNDSDF